MKHDHDQFAPREPDAERVRKQSCDPAALKRYWQDNRTHSGQLYVPADAKSWWVP